MPDKDPNVVCGDDFEEPINFATVGELILNNLKEGGDRTALVRIIQEVK
jgi:hypothetical protein